MPLPNIESLARRAVGSSLSKLTPPPVKRLIWNMLAMRPAVNMYGSRVLLPETLRRSPRFQTVTYQRPLAAMIERLVRPGMTFCDVGANVGIFTLLAARLVGPGGKVYAFEPAPANAALLRRSIALNGYRNIVLREAAAAEASGPLTLHLSAEPGQHSLFQLQQFATGQSCQVAAVRLDSFPEMASVDVMKIDTEGAEVQALRGLGAYRPANILIECNEERLRAAGSSAEALRRTLVELGYTRFDTIDGSRNKDDWHVHGLAPAAYHSASGMSGRE